MLDQVALIKQSMPDFPIISNGNVITYEDVVSNRQSTTADGIMSAEGILNNPAIYLPRFGDVDDDKDKNISIVAPSLLISGNTQQCHSGGAKDKLLRKLKKKLRKINSAEQKLSNGDILDEEQQYVHQVVIQYAKGIKKTTMGIQKNLFHQNLLFTEGLAQENQL